MLKEKRDRRRGSDRLGLVSLCYRHSSANLKAPEIGFKRADTHLFKEYHMAYISLELGALENHLVNMSF